MLNLEYTDIWNTWDMRLCMCATSLMWMTRWDVQFLGVSLFYVLSPQDRKNFRAFSFYLLWIKTWHHQLAHCIVYFRCVTVGSFQIIRRANECGEDPTALSGRYCEEFLKDMDDLQCLRPTHQPRVTEHMEQIKEMIDKVLTLDNYFQNLFLQVKVCWRSLPFSPCIEIPLEQRQGLTPVAVKICYCSFLMQAFLSFLFPGWRL